jgi:hypothetical protein
MLNECENFVLTEHSTPNPQQLSSLLLELSLQACEGCDISRPSIMKIEVGPRCRLRYMTFIGLSWYMIIFFFFLLGFFFFFYKIFPPSNRTQNESSRIVWARLDKNWFGSKLGSSSTWILFSNLSSARLEFTSSSVRLVKFSSF